VSFPDRLVENSSMTKKQLEAMISYMRVSRGEMKLREASSAMPGGPIKIGSFYGMVNQARKNFREALLTVLIGIWVDAIRLDDVRKLFELVGVGSRELSEQDEERFLQVLGALLDRMVV